MSEGSSFPPVSSVNDTNLDFQVILPLEIHVHNTCTLSPYGRVPKTRDTHQGTRVYTTTSASDSKSKTIPKAYYPKYPILTSTHQSITPTSQHTKKDKEKEVNHSNLQSNPPRQTTQMTATNPTLLLIFVGQRHHQSI